MKFFGRTFMRQEPQPAPAAVVPMRRSESATLGDMIERDLEQMRHEVKPAKEAPASETPTGLVIERLIRAGLPAVVNDSKALQQAKARNAKRQLEEERAIAADLARRTPPAKDDEGALYESYDPEFV